MKYLKRFEDLNDIQNDDASDVSEEVKQVVDRYSTQFSEFSGFFTDFIDRFPDEESFKDRLWDYFDDDEYDDDDADDDDDDDERRFDRLWSPEAEVNMLENEVGNYPDSEIWVDFHNDLYDTDWCKKNKK